MFCSKCGEKLNENAKFCPNCGQQIGGTVIHKDDEKDIIDLSIHKPNPQENETPLFLIVFVIFLIILICIGINKSKPTTNKSDYKQSLCPSVVDMEDAIKQYKSVNVIQKINPELNTVYISSTAQKVMNVDSMKTLGYITACYSAHVKGNDLVWAEIYNYNTGKRIAKYSESYGFKMY